MDKLSYAKWMLKREQDANGDHFCDCERRTYSYDRCSLCWKTIIKFLESKDGVAL